MKWRQVRLRRKTSQPVSLEREFYPSQGSRRGWWVGRWGVVGLLGVLVFYFFIYPGALANRYRYNRKKNFRRDGRRLLSPCLTHGRLLPCAVVYLRVCARVRVPSSPVVCRPAVVVRKNRNRSKCGPRGRIRKASENITGETPDGPSKVNHAEVPPRAASRASPCATASRHASSAAALER